MRLTAREAPYRYITEITERDDIKIDMDLLRRVFADEPWTIPDAVKVTENTCPGCMTIAAADMLAGLKCSQCGKYG